MTRLDTTPRPTYAGPRTSATRPDGRYRFVLGVPFTAEDHADAGPHRPALAAAMDRVKHAFPRLEGPLSGTVGTTAPLGTPDARSCAWIDGDLTAGSDLEAAALVLAAVAAIGADAVPTGRLWYMEPTERGASSAPEPVIAWGR